MKIVTGLALLLMVLVSTRGSRGNHRQRGRGQPHLQCRISRPSETVVDLLMGTAVLLLIVVTALKYYGES